MQHQNGTISEPKANTMVSSYTLTKWFAGLGRMWGGGKGRECRTAKDAGRWLHNVALGHISGVRGLQWQQFHDLEIWSERSRVQAPVSCFTGVVVRVAIWETNDMDVSKSEASRNAPSERRSCTRSRHTRAHISRRNTRSSRHCTILQDCRRHTASPPALRPTTPKTSRSHMCASDLHNPVIRHAMADDRQSQKGLDR